MTVFTNVSDDVLEPGDPIRSVDILAIKENTNYNHQNTVLEILQEDIFTTSGTFTKATGFDDDDTVVMMLIKGGGSGAACRVSTQCGVATGGGSGGLVALVGRYGDISSSIVYMIAAGGAAVTTTSTGGTNGNSSGQTAFRNDANTLNVISTAGGAGGFADISTTFAFAARSSGPASFCRVFAVDKPTSLLYAQTQIFLGSKADIFCTTDTTNENNIAQAGPFQVGFATQMGGSSTRRGGTNFTAYNDNINVAFFTGGGLGSGTANGQNATGIGCGGGGSVRQDVNATSGAGGNGALVVRYYRGRVSFDQFFQVGA